MQYQWALQKKTRRQLLYMVQMILTVSGISVATLLIDKAVQLIHKELIIGQCPVSKTGTHDRNFQQTFCATVPLSQK